MGRLLDRYDQMQRRPFGTNTALSDGSQYGAGGTAGSQYRRQGAAYGQALRILNRQARRGDARAAMASIDVRDQAMNSGFSPGGIQRRGEVQGASVAYGDTLRRGAEDMEQAQAVDRKARGQFLAGESTVNPNATAGAGRGYSAQREPEAGQFNRGQPRILQRGGADTMDYQPNRDGVIPELGTRATDFTPGANVTNPPDGFQPVGDANPDGTSRGFPTNPSPAGGIGTLPQETPATDVTGAPKAKRVSMIDGRPASEVLAEMRSAKTASDAQTAGAPKAKPVDPVEDYMASVEGYQAGLAGDGDPAAADARATATYQNASELDKIRMSSALMKRAAELNKKQSRILKRR